MGKISFKYCPVCGGELQEGKISVPVSRRIGIMNGFTDTINFYCEEDIQYNKEHPLKSAFSVSYTKSTCFSAFKQPCIPAGYCEKCDRIIADIEIRESYNPIGEESLPTYDMDYYSIGTESTISDENVYVMDDPSYEEWTDLIEWNNFDDKNEE
ncbi:MAG: hypothetical protein IJX61_03430 [Ruminococcus sp.]|nr:hypothetical protein [Ruminococcus sp.]